MTIEPPEALSFKYGDHCKSESEPRRELERAAKFNVDKIKREDIVSSGGASDDGD